MKIRAQAVIIDSAGKGPRSIGAPIRSPAVRIVKGRPVQHRVSVSNKIPAVVPIDVPAGARRISLRAVKAQSGVDEKPGITTMRLMACESDGCKTLETTSGADKASLILYDPQAGPLMLGIDYEGQNSLGTEFLVEGLIAQTEEVVRADWPCAYEGNTSTSCAAQLSCLSSKEDDSTIEFIDLSVNDARWRQWFDRTAHAIVTPLELARGLSARTCLLAAT